MRNNVDSDSTLITASPTRLTLSPFCWVGVGGEKIESQSDPLPP